MNEKIGFIIVSIGCVGVFLVSLKIGLTYINGKRIERLSNPNLYWLLQTLYLIASMFFLWLFLNRK